MRSRIASIVIGIFAWGWAACGGEDITAPRPGTIRISTATTGLETDPDGYTITLDGAEPVTIAPTATIALEVEPGDHTVELGGVAPTCTAEGDLRRAVPVSENETVEVAYTIHCDPVVPPPPPPPPPLTVVVATTGPRPDPDGYSLRIDEGAEQPVGINTSVEIPGLEPGTHTVALTGLALNCAVEGENPVTVETGGTSPAGVAFAVTCRGSVTTWTPVESGVLADFTTVWSPQDGMPLVAGERSIRRGLEAVVLSFDGERWLEQYVEEDLRPRALWGSAIDDVYLVGYRFLEDATRVLHYDGERWSAVPEFDQEQAALEAVWGSSAQDVFAVGFDDLGVFRQSAIFHYDGSAWLRMEIPGEVRPALTDVWGFSASDVYAVGRDEAADPAPGVVLHYDGIQWAPVLQVDGLVLNGIWGSSPTDIFAVGFLVEERNGQFVVTGAVWHYDGAGWSSMTLPEDGVLNEVWGTAAGDVYAVGADGLILHYDGTAWSATRTLPESLLGVWSGLPGEVWAVGVNGAIVRGTP